MSKKILKNIIGITIVLMIVGISISLIVRQPVSAQEQLPELVQIHVDAITAAQTSNGHLLPELHRIQSQVNANNATARSSRLIICTSFKEYCKAEYINPAGAEVDLSEFADFR